MTHKAKILSLDLVQTGLLWILEQLLCLCRKQTFLSLQKSYVNILDKAAKTWIALKTIIIIILMSNSQIVFQLARIQIFLTSSCLLITMCTLYRLVFTLTRLITIHVNCSGTTMTPVITIQATNGLSEHLFLTYSIAFTT